MLKEGTNFVEFGVRLEARLKRVMRLAGTVLDGVGASCRSGGVGLGMMSE